MRPLAFLVFFMLTVRVCDVVGSGIGSTMFLPICGPGTGAVEGSAACEECGPGFYQDMRYGAECKKCPGGTHSEESGRTTPCDTCTAADSYMTDAIQAPNRCNCANNFQMENEYLCRSLEHCDYVNEMTYVIMRRSDSQRFHITYVDIRWFDGDVADGALIQIHSSIMGQDVTCGHVDYRNSATYTNPQAVEGDYRSWKVRVACEGYGLGVIVYTNVTGATLEERQLSGSQVSVAPIVGDLQCVACEDDGSWDNMCMVKPATAVARNDGSWYCPDGEYIYPYPGKPKCVPSPRDYTSVDGIVQACDADSYAVDGSTTCWNCGKCTPGQYRALCGWHGVSAVDGAASLLRGECRACADCEAGQVRTGCDWRGARSGEAGTCVSEEFLSETAWCVDVVESASKLTQAGSSAERKTVVSRGLGGFNFEKLFGAAQDGADGVGFVCSGMCDGTQTYDSTQCGGPYACGVHVCAMRLGEGTVMEAHACPVEGPTSAESHAVQQAKHDTQCQPCTSCGVDNANAEDDFGRGCAQECTRILCARGQIYDWTEQSAETIDRCKSCGALQDTRLCSAADHARLGLRTSDVSGNRARVFLVGCEGLEGHNAVGYGSCSRCAWVPTCESGTYYAQCPLADWDGRRSERECPACEARAGADAVVSTEYVDGHGDAHKAYCQVLACEGARTGIRADGAVCVDACEGVVCDATQTTLACLLPQQGQCVEPYPAWGGDARTKDAVMPVHANMLEPLVDVGASPTNTRHQFASFENILVDHSETREHQHQCVWNAIDVVDNNMNPDACVPCGHGSFKTAPGAHLCTVCGTAQQPNKYGDAAVATHLAAHCAPCAPNSGQNHSAVSRQQRMLSPEDCLCFPHFQYNGSLCLPCPVFTVKPGYSQGECSFCAAGQYVDVASHRCFECYLVTAATQLGQTQTHEHQAVNAIDPALQWGESEDDCVCDLGFQRIEAQCAACAPGHFRGARLPTECLPCALNTFQDGAAALGCSACPGNAYTDGLGKTSLQDCQCPPGFAWNLTDCVACPPGTVRNNTAMHSPCDACLSGEYQDALGQRECRSCGANEWSAPPFAGLDACLCLPSFGLRDGLCLQCEHGSFSAGGAAGATSPACSLCPANKNTSAPGSTTIDACACVPGHGDILAGVDAALGCAACATGYFAGGGSNVPCTHCGFGTVTEPEEAATNSECCLCDARIGLYAQVAAKPAPTTR